jgi:hypothetical protein
VENNNELLKGIFHVVVSIGILIYGSILLGFILGIVILAVGPSEDISDLNNLFIVFSIFHLTLLIICISMFYIGLRQGIDGINLIEERSKENKASTRNTQPRRLKRIEHE